MEDLQTTEADETTLVFSDSDGTGDPLKDAKKKDRKELFQINTHPATVVVANNKRDRRLKQIVMRVVAFCKKEHDEGQQIPFRFFKKRASVMTGVSLSTIHRIETIDMKAPTSQQPETGSAGKSRPKTKDGQRKAAKKKKKKKKKEAGGCEGAVHVSGAAASSSLVQQHSLEGSHDPNNLHVHFQISAAANGNLAPVAKPTAKKKKKRAKTDSSSSDAGGGGGVILHNQHTHCDATPTTAAIITTLQPAALHAVSTVGVGGEGVVTTINVHNAMVNPQQHPAACTWTAGPIGPFAMGELRDGHHQVQLPATHHLQVNGQHVQTMGSALPALGAQLQPISVAAAMSQQAAGFAAGHMVESGGQVNWATAGGGMPAAAAFGTLPAAATLVGQQMVQTAYPNHPPPPPGHTLTATTPQQQPPQHSPVFYQF